MSKTYILQKDLPDGAKVGDRYLKGEYRYYNERMTAEAKGIIESANWETWQVENNPEWFLPEETKSNDSFQWNDSLACEWAGYLEEALNFGASTSEIPRILSTWKNKHTPQPTDHIGIDRNGDDLDMNKKLYAPPFEKSKPQEQRMEVDFPTRGNPRVFIGGIEYVSPEKVDELCEKAFNAARELTPTRTISFPDVVGQKKKYNDFQDYKNSKQ